MRIKSSWPMYSVSWIKDIRYSITKYYGTIE